MDSFVNTIASNVAGAAILAIVAFVVARTWASPQLAHALWVLVLIKFVTPPVIHVPLRVPTVLQDAGSLTRSHNGRPIDALQRAFARPPGAILPSRTTGQSPSTVLTTASQPAPPGASDEVGKSDAPMLSAPVPFEVDVLRASGKIGAVAPRAADAPTREDSSDLPWLWLCAACAAWLAGSLIYTAVLTRRCLRIARLLSRPVAADGQLQIEARRLAKQLGMFQCPPVRVVDARIPPLVWGLGLRPVIVMPQKLLNDLTPAQREGVLLHELAHIRRRDYCVRWLEVIVIVPFWWNPIAWWARREIQTAEEQCCDAWVIWANPAGRRQYGRALLKTIEFVSAPAAAIAAAGSAFGKPLFRRRIEMILKLDSHPKMSRLAWCGVFLLATAVVPLGARALGNSVSADDAPPSDEIVSQTGDDEIAPASQDAGEEAGPQDATVFNPSFESVLGLAESGGEPDSSREPETAHRARLAGTWRVVDIQVDRKQVPSRFDYYYWQFDADASTIKTAWKGGYLAINTPDDVGYRFVVNPDADPMELTIYGENMLIQAIYRWEGDALKLCFYGRSERDRPSQFPDTDSWRAKPSAPVMEFKLVKDSRPVPPSAAYDTGESSRDVDPAIAQAEQAYRHAARLAERGFVSQAELARTKAEYFQARSNAEYAALQRESQSQLLELDVAEAELKVNAAKSQYESLRRANEQVAGSVTDVEFEKQRFAVELAQIEARRARIKLELYQQQTSVRVSE